MHSQDGASQMSPQWQRSNGDENGSAGYCTIVNAHRMCCYVSGIRITASMSSSLNGRRIKSKEILLPPVSREGDAPAPSMGQPPL